MAVMASSTMASSESKQSNSKSKKVFVPRTLQAIQVEPTRIVNRSLIPHCVELAPIALARNFTP